MTILLELRQLCVEVDGKELLHDINMTIPRGEVHALLGPNGSGKTSLMMTIMGFSGYHVCRGQILFDGEDITDLDLTGRARLGIGIAQQRPPTITGVKLRDILEYVSNGDSWRTDQVEALVKESRTERFLDRDINAGLSGGEIKRSELIQLLVSRPRFSMMDEPDSGVDLESLSLVGSLINDLLSKDLDHPAKRRSGIIITHTGHILNYLQADKAHILLNGRIACSGNPRLMLQTVGERGYEECAYCMREAA
jgi:Fe-S cluster assembly ATP-binding protein